MKFVLFPFGFFTEVNIERRIIFMKILNPKKELEEEIVVVRGDMENMDPGSEEYLNAAKAINQLAEASQKTKKIDVNQMITGGISIVMFLLYMGFSENHITDTRAYNWAKGLFRK